MSDTTTSAPLSANQDRFERTLGKVLHRRLGLSENELNEALEQQVIMGGNLATSVWELGLAGGEELMKISAKLLDMPAAPPKAVSKVPKKILRLLTRDFVARHRIIPLGLKGKELRVATCEPWNLAALDEAAFQSGYRIQPYFLAEVPLVKLLDKLYGIPASARFRLAPQARLRDRDKTAQPQADDQVGEDLMDEAAFEAMYAAGPGGVETAPEETDEPAGSAPAVDPDAPDSEIVELGEAEMVEADEAPEPILLLDEAAEPPAPALTPIADLPAARQAVAAAPDREGLGEAMVRFALSKGRRAVLFSRQAELWMGWTGAGPDVDPARVRSLMIPSEAGTAFGLVGTTGGHFLGPLADHPVHGRFLDALGGARPVNAGLFPVHFHGRIVFGLYLDGGDGATVTPDIADILILAQQVPVALQRLVTARQG